METAVALPTLTPLQISFGCGEKACRVGRFEIECVRWGCCLQWGQNKTTSQMVKISYIPFLWVLLHLPPFISYTDLTEDISDSSWAISFSSITISKITLSQVKIETSQLSQLPLQTPLKISAYGCPVYGYVWPRHAFAWKSYVCT